MTINMETMARIKADVKSHIKFDLLCNEEKYHAQFIKHNLALQKKILHNCIASAYLREGTTNSLDVYYKFKKEPNKELYISEDVPDSIITELAQYINDCVKERKEYFDVSSTKNGRYDFLFKGVLYCIKQLNLKLKNQEIDSLENVEHMYKSMSLEKLVELYFNDMINLAVMFSKCYEADSKNYKMCLKVLDKNFREYSKYQYCISSEIEKQLKKDIDLIVMNLSKRDYFTKNVEFNDAKSYLLDTLMLAERDIDEIIENHEILKSKDYAALIKIYRQIFKNSKDRFISSQKTTQFIKVLKESKMFHRIFYENKTIYPFVYDLLLMSFNYAIYHIQYKEENTNINKMMKKVNEAKYLYLEKNSDENYHFNEFTRLAEEIPMEYKILDDPIIVILKHYSEFLDCRYENIANILRQLRFESSGHYGNTYKLLQDQRNIDLNLDDDYFRKLSLYII